jgi:hypothetical protein
MAQYMIDITGVNKVALLHELWTRSNPAAFFAPFPQLAPRFDRDEATVAVVHYIDYFCGRCIKSDLSGDTASPHQFDRDAGRGAFTAAVTAVRTGK